MSGVDLIAKGIKRMANQVQLTHKRNCFLKKIRHIRAPYKLHIGCGKIHFEGWINVDADKSAQGADVEWDLRLGIPLPDNSCTLIYSEHLLEHLKVDKAVELLKELKRVLISEGVVRIAMPSLEALLAKSQSADWRNQDWLTWPEHQFIQTRAEMINISFRWWGHEWLYDREELDRRLKEAGFLKIGFREWGQSDVEELRNRESRKDSLLICEAGK